jgi:hypothetical protein
MALVSFMKRRAVLKEPKCRTKFKPTFNAGPKRRLPKRQQQW